MSTSCSCLKLCAIATSVANFIVGVCILTHGIVWLRKYFENEITIGYVIAAFQLSFFLIFGVVVLLTGIVKAEEKLVSLYLLLSTLTWFVITNLVVFYLSFGRPLITETAIAVTPTLEPTASPEPIPGQQLPLEKTIGFSIGIALIWCGQLSVYKFHQQVIENNMIDAGESYVRSALNDEEKSLKNL